MIVFFYVQEFYNGDLLNCETTHDKMGRTAQVSDGILFFHKKYCRNCMILLSKQVFIVLICWFLFYIFSFCVFCVYVSSRGEPEQCVSVHIVDIVILSIEVFFIIFF